MKELNEIAEIGNSICATLDRIIENDRKFYKFLNEELSLLEFEVNKTAKNLENIRKNLET